MDLPRCEPAKFWVVLKGLGNRFRNRERIRRSRLCNGDSSGQHAPEYDDLACVVAFHRRHATTRTLTKADQGNYNSISFAAVFAFFLSL